MWRSVLVLAIIVGAVRAAAASPTTLHFASLAPTGSRWEKTLSAESLTVAVVTRSRVSVQWDFDGAQGDEADTIAKLKAGTIDGTEVSTVGLALLVPSIRVLELPMMFASPEEMTYVVDRMWGHFQKAFEQAGYALGPPVDFGPVVILTRRRVQSVAELARLKVWVWDVDDVMHDLDSELGITGVPLDRMQVEPALKGGTVDACYGPPLFAMVYGWEAPKTPFMSSLVIGHSIGATVVRVAALGAVSAADQSDMHNVDEKVATRLRTALAKDNDTSRKQLARKGVRIDRTPDTMKTDLETAAKATWQALVGKLYTQQELDMVLAYRRQYRLARAAHQP